MKCPLVCLLAALALASPAPGQSTAFEVVSIKPAPQNKKELQQHLGNQIDPAMVDFGGGEEWSTHSPSRSAFTRTGRHVSLKLRIS